jgi:hypothetical protein
MSGPKIMARFWIHVMTLVTMTEYRGGFTQAQRAAFFKLFAWEHFWLLKITTDPHIFAHVNMECLYET